METATAYESKSQPETLAAECARQGLTIRAVFVPFSQSRNKANKDPSLNWLVTLLRDGREILITDYMQGCGHCPSYKASIKEIGGQNSIMRDGAIRNECETGRVNRFQNSRKEIIAPTAHEIMYSLILDSEVLDAGTFEEWAGNFGYDADSRKAESIYRARLEIALKLRNGLGEAGLSAIRDAAQDY